MVCLGASVLDTSDAWKIVRRNLSHPPESKKHRQTADAFLCTPGSRCSRFFTRYVKQAGALPNDSAVPWRQKRGHDISFLGRGLHFLKCGENRKAVANPRRTVIIIPIFHQIVKHLLLYTLFSVSLSEAGLQLLSGIPGCSPPSLLHHTGGQDPSSWFRC